MKKFKEGLVQFRLVVLNEDDTVKEVFFVSKEYAPSSKFSVPFCQDLYECLMTANQKYNFSNWEEVPSMEFQARRKGMNEWEYLSDPINDYMNL